jgi:phytoene synthase
MSFSRDAIETSYNYCRRMSRRANSNFHAGFLLLPAEKRRAMEALYAFMRHTDDVTDAAPSDGSRRDALCAWRAALEESLEEEGKSESAQSSVGNSSFIIHHSLLQIGPSILPALADTVRRFHIPREHLDAVIDGVEMDLDRTRYETFDELKVYCERVASAVGLACIHVWGFRGPEAFPAARQAGIAMQLTNILRDLKQDAQAGRVYLPLADLRESGYSVEDLMAGVDDQRFRRLMALEIARTEQFYCEGAKLWRWLDPDGRRIFGLMMATYWALLQKIVRRPGEVFRRHVRLGRMKKLQLLARWSLFPPRQLSFVSTDARDEGGHR